MTFEQAVMLLEIAERELKENHGVLGIRSTSKGTELHIRSKETFESLPGEAELTTSTEDFDHFEKTVGNITYICLYKKPNTE